MWEWVQDEWVGGQQHGTSRKRERTRTEAERMNERRRRFRIYPLPFFDTFPNGPPSAGSIYNPTSCFGHYLHTQPTNDPSTHATNERVDLPANHPTNQFPNKSKSSSLSLYLTTARLILLPSVHVRKSSRERVTRKAGSVTALGPTRTWPCVCFCWVV